MSKGKKVRTFHTKKLSKIQIDSSETEEQDNIKIKHEQKSVHQT